MWNNQQTISDSKKKLKNIFRFCGCKPAGKGHCQSNQRMWPSGDNVCHFRFCNCKMKTKSWSCLCKHHLGIFSLFFKSLSIICSAVQWLKANQNNLDMPDEDLTLTLQTSSRPTSLTARLWLKLSNAGVFYQVVQLHQVEASVIESCLPRLTATIWGFEDFAVRWWLCVGSKWACLWRK